VSKIFIIGLPRTGTSSVCAALLDSGFKVAHTAYTKASIEQADVLADTPIYVDYPHLDRLFPESKFIYLTRSEGAWVPSIKTLLAKLTPRRTPGQKGYHPILARCIEAVFGPVHLQKHVNDEKLWDSYTNHQQQVLAYFEQRAADCLMIDVSQKRCYAELMSFLSMPCAGEFPRLNGGGRVNAWQTRKHPNKVDSFAFGADRRQYYCF
jgi:hypothetical protein